MILVVVATQARPAIYKIMFGIYYCVNPNKTESLFYLFIYFKKLYLLVVICCGFLNDQCQCIGLANGQYDSSTNILFCSGVFLHFFNDFIMTANDKVLNFDEHSRRHCQNVKNRPD